MTVDDEKCCCYRQMTPALIVNGSNKVIWRNRWAELLFKIAQGEKHLGQLPDGDAMTAYAERVRKDENSSLLRLNRAGMAIDVEARRQGIESIMFKFHPAALLWDSMLEMHKFMQDIALAAGDRINNPLTTVLNCLELIREGAERGKTKDIPLFAEMAIREAYSMKDFGDWVRRLSEEPPCTEAFDLVAVIREILVRRNCEESLIINKDIPLVKGDCGHASSVLGGLVNLCRQADESGQCWVKICYCRQPLVTLEITPRGPQVRDLRMLTEEFYGGLGLLAARYLLSQMQAQMILDYMGDVGIRVTFLEESYLPLQNIC